MVYEPSNRDARVWGWDTPLFDVGGPHPDGEDATRVRGLYGQPHRGARCTGAARRRGPRREDDLLVTYGPTLKAQLRRKTSRRWTIAAKAAALSRPRRGLLYGSILGGGARGRRRSTRARRNSVNKVSARLAAYENANGSTRPLARTRNLPVESAGRRHSRGRRPSRYKVIGVSVTNLRPPPLGELESWGEAGGRCPERRRTARDEANAAAAFSSRPALWGRSRRGRALGEG